MYLPLTNGFPSYTDNVGKVKNKGVEVALSGYPIRNTDRTLGKGGSHMIFAAVGGGMIIACGAFVWYILKR